MINKIVTRAVFLLAMLSPTSTFAQRASFSVIPLPQDVTVNERENFYLNPATRICYEKGNKQMKRNAQFLAEYIQQTVGMELKIGTKASGQNVIALKTGLNNENKEAYQLTVDAKGLLIQGSSAAGVFYGIQTLRKSLPVMLKGKATSVTIPYAQIKDAPRFAYRGTHLDVSRHFITTDSIYRFIDMLALHNINRFHWHLTDDQGWRIEIKKYPKLTKVGAYRPETVIGHNTGKYDGRPHQGFYSQKELREIVKYAAERNITIIPEIDMPGHMQAALAAYPELGCTGGPYEIWTKWGISDDVLCVGNDKTLKFIDDVLDEVADIFPSEYIHVGGDECPKVRWKDCPKCQARIRANHLEAQGKHSAEERLQSYLINHAEKHLNQLGRQMIGWDETLEGGLAPNATVMSWRGEGGGIEAARQHHKVIMTPNTYLYFDYYQTKDIQNEPEAIGGYLPIQTVYNYEPMPSRLSADEQKYIIGVQANIWTEYMPTFRQVEYMALPRLAALSEVQWSQPEDKSYAYFTHRIHHMIDHYRLNNYNFAKHIFDVSSNITSDFDKHAISIDLTTIDAADIHYTLDGTTPTVNSPLYKDRLDIRQACTFKAAAFRGNERSNVMEETFTFNKATVCPIQMLQPINGQYAYNGAMTLVDGLQGFDTNFKTGRWIGFYRNDMEAVIDLRNTTTISEVGFNTCVEKGAWIFDTRGVEISVSQDGKDFVSVFKEDYPSMTEANPNQICHHRYEFAPTSARFVKVKALSERQIPQWHGGKGNPGFLFVDEIIVK